ncbi:hypothetical protein ACPOL_6344 [Acidisarcina polymorpha]|uniref:Uncharacterized protein n=1 Tax=Acidisarcina polymorpha TaxID=2211140 RepID=A0A2Z5G9B7_9BACT|nr:hypothetical protein ACPOL_6344 [Acidisarcina polymorpha]
MKYWYTDPMLTPAFAPTALVLNPQNPPPPKEKRQLPR